MADFYLTQTGDEVQELLNTVDPTAEELASEIRERGSADTHLQEQIDNLSADAYRKPQAGIPATDMTLVVQESLANANASIAVVGDKSYTPDEFSGLGRVNLEKNIQTIEGVEKNVLTQDMFYKGDVSSRVPNTNTIFVIQYDYDLNDPDGENPITIPEGCVLKFDGGSLRNGTLIGNNTKIDTDIVKIFGDDILFGGNWTIDSIYPEWFGAKGDNVANDSAAFQKCFDNVEVLGDVIKVTNPEYKIDETLYIKRKINLEINKGTILHYWGTSHFIVLGDSQDNAKMSGRIKGGVFRVHESDAGDVFHIVWAVQFTFDSVTTRYGKNGFNTYHNDFNGAYYAYFVNCRVEWAQENGYKIAPYGTSQVNQIQFIRSSSSNCGNPVYGTHTNVPDNVNGNGFLIGGTAVSCLGCSTEVNNGYGIKVPDSYSLDGATINVLYTEHNLVGTVYIGRPVGSGNGYKGSISINGVYESSGKLCTLAMTDFDRKNRCIYYDRYFISVPNNELKSSCICTHDTIDVIASKLGGVRLPFRLSYVRDGSDSYAFAVLGICLGGALYKVNQSSIEDTTIVASEVTNVTGATVTLDSAVPSNYDYVNIVCNGHPLYFLDKTLLKKYPLTLSVYSPNIQNETISIKSTSFNNDRTAFTMTSTMQGYWGNVKVGDVVYFVSNSAQSYWRLYNLSNGNGNSIVEIPSDLSSHPLFDKFCALLLTGLAGDITQITQLQAVNVDSVCRGVFNDRPSANIGIGFRYFRTDGNYPIYYGGSNKWYNSEGVEVTV